MEEASDSQHNDGTTMNSTYSLDFRYPHDLSTTHKLEVTLVSQEKF